MKYIWKCCLRYNSHFSQVSVHLLMHLFNWILKDPFAGIVNSPEWRPMRQKALAGLRDFGAGAASLEGKILLECDALTQEFRKFEGKAFDCQEAVTNAVSNVICSIVFGKR